MVSPSAPFLTFDDLVGDQAVSGRHTPAVAAGAQKEGTLWQGLAPVMAAPNRHIGVNAAVLPRSGKRPHVVEDERVARAPDPAPGRLVDGDVRREALPRACARLFGGAAQGERFGARAGALALFACAGEGALAQLSLFDGLLGSFLFPGHTAILTSAMPRKPPPQGHVLYELGKLIARQRAARGLSQRDFAILIGVGATTQQYYESGLRDPGIDMLIRIAHQCDLPLSAFLSPLDRFDVPLREKRGKA